ncbi:YciI family protein [Streptomyces sp. NPDC093546]|uniref:YciI family protein n=1 Tax=Streptomyces sp. NPDC093546 TaxID=3366040 RepID=UPI003816C200
MSETAEAGAVPETAAPEIRPTHHVVTYRPGPGWIEGKPLFEQPLQGHAEHNAELEAEGLLFLSGPFLDRNGGMSVLAVSDTDEAEKIVAKDPAVKNGVFLADVAPFFAAFPRGAAGPAEGGEEAGA